MIDISGLNDGQHSVTVFAKDYSGNWSAPEVHEFLLLTKPLQVKQGMYDV